LARKKEILETAFDAVGIPDDELDSVPGSVSGYALRYNIAPGQEIVAVRQDAGDPARRMGLLSWGLMPSWMNGGLSGAAPDVKRLPKIINARSETAAAKPSFRELLRTRRCLIPADGFYEWKREGKEKLPFCFTLVDDSAFALAGLWERWKSSQGQVVESCAILTTTANELMSDIHDRMPVIVPPNGYGRWLDPGFTNLTELQSLLKPYPAGAMRRYRVSQRVNQVKNDDAECAAEIEAA
jgi:putative SOS response-associated peptidase YedK